MAATGYTRGDPNKVSKSGDTMTGQLVLPSDPSTNLAAATKQYVDTADAAHYPKTGGVISGVVTTDAVPGSLSTLPAGYGASTSPTGIAIGSTYPSDDVVGGTDGTGRLNLYSYQRANAYSFGEVVRIFNMRKDSKQMIAWYAPVNGFDANRDANPGGFTPVTWVGTHWESNGHSGNHKHWEVEIPDSAGALQGRLEIPFGTQSNETIGLDKTSILTNLADFVVRCGGTNTVSGAPISNALRLSANAGLEKAMEFSNDVDGVNKRWKIRATSEAESTGAAGTNFQIARYDDTGVLTDVPILITRSSGLVTIGGSSATAAGLLVRTSASVGRTALLSSAFLAVDTDGTKSALFVRATADGTANLAALGLETLTTSKRALDYRVTGDAVSRLRVDASIGGSGVITLGDGTTADTNLYRGGANLLKTDDALEVAGRLRAQGFDLPMLAPVSSLPQYRAATVIQNFQTGHGYTASGSGVASSDMNSTAQFVRGTQSARITTLGTGAVANIRKYGGSALDLTGKLIRLTFRVTDVTHLNQINFQVGTSSVANNFAWRVHTHSGSAQNMVQSAEWVTLDLSWADVRSASGTYSINADGTPSTKTGFTDFLFQVVDDNTASNVTVYLQSIEVVPDTTTTFPNGVVSITFDDSYSTQFTAARPKMDALGFRGTCYTICDVVGTAGYLTKAQMRAMQDQSGWEIAGHAFTATNHNAKFTTLSTQTVLDEIRLCRAWLVDNGFTSDNFAYPGGWFGPTTDGDPIDLLTKKYFASARGISAADQIANFPPSMPHRMCAVSGVGSLAGASSPANPTKLLSTGGPLDRTKLSGNWLNLVFHEVVAGTAATTNQCSQTDFDAIMDGIAARGIPVVPVADVLRHHD